MYDIQNIGFSDRVYGSVHHKRVRHYKCATLVNCCCKKSCIETVIHCVPTSSFKIKYLAINYIRFPYRKTLQITWALQLPTILVLNFPTTFVSLPTQGIEWLIWSIVFLTLLVHNIQGTILRDIWTLIKPRIEMFKCHLFSFFWNSRVLLFIRLFMFQSL